MNMDSWGGGGSNLFALQSNFQNQDGGCSLFFFFLNSWTRRLEVERAEKVDLKSSIHLSFKTVFPQFDPVIIYITRLEPPPSRTGTSCWFRPLTGP